MSGRILRAIALLTLGLAGWPVAAAAVVPPEVEAGGRPGDYVTVPFPVEGTGTYTFTVLSPPGWTPLRESGEVQLEGQGLVAVTYRIPDQVDAGERVDLELFLSREGEASTRMHGTISVAREVDLALQVPNEISGRSKLPLSYQITVSNRGNAPDVALLSAAASAWNVEIRPERIELAPGEQAVATVTVVPEGETSDGYFRLTRIEVRSEADPDFERSAAVRETFFDNGRSSRPASGRPQLSFRLDGGLAGGLVIAEDTVNPRLSYRAAPALRGDLSDYVTMEADTNQVSGSLEDPFAELPSELSLAFASEDWEVAASLGDRFGVSAGFSLGEWQLGVGGNLDPGSNLRYGLDATATSKIPGLDLRIGARTSGTESRRSDGLIAQYRLPLDERITLGIGGSLSGSDARERSYSLIAGLNQSLAYEAPQFEVRQLYNGVPVAGFHSITVEGESQSLGPVGLSAVTNLQVSPTTIAWSNSAAVAGSPLPGLSTRLAGNYETSSGSVLGGSSWTVTPGVRYGFGLPGGVRMAFAGRYSHTQALVGDRSTRNVVSGGFTVGYSGIIASALGEYGVSVPLLGATNRYDTRIQASAGYVFGAGSSVRAGYNARWETFDGTLEQHEYRASWQQPWSFGLQSRLSYARDNEFREGELNQDERVTLVVGQSDVVLDDLVLSAGYSLSSSTSLLDFGGDYRHNLSIGVGYVWEVPIDTPDPLVDLFGGRRGGEVRGVAYLDEDFDGIADDDEERLTGVRVVIGQESAVTEQDGSYRLRVPSGTYDMQFPTGLPATVDLIGDRSVDVVENEAEERDLPFAPVASLELTLFDDSDQDGVRDENERGIPFGGVTIVGPMQRTLQVDGRGSAVVSGLLEGHYTISVDADRLPKGYRATGEAIVVALDPQKRSSPVVLGAARPPRQVVTTFDGNSIAVVAQALVSSAAPGQDVEFEAYVTGRVDAVEVLIGQQWHPLEGEGNRWTGAIRVPTDQTIGMSMLPVRARAGDRISEQSVFLNVVSRPVVTTADVAVRAGQQTDLEVQAEFRSESAAIVFPDETVALETEDGYAWSTTWTAPYEPGEITGRVIVGGEEHGVVRIQVQEEAREDTANRED